MNTISQLNNFFYQAFSADDVKNNSITETRTDELRDKAIAERQAEQQQIKHQERIHPITESSKSSQIDVYV